MSKEREIAEKITNGWADDCGSFSRIGILDRSVLCAAIEAALVAARNDALEESEMLMRDCGLKQAADKIRALKEVKP